MLEMYFKKFLSYIMIQKNKKMSQEMMHAKKYFR